MKLEEGAMENVGGMELGKRENSKKNSRNFYLVHHKYHSAVTEI